MDISLPHADLHSLLEPDPSTIDCEDAPLEIQRSLAEKYSTCHLDNIFIFNDWLYSK